MPPKKGSGPRGGDRLGALPDDVLHLVLSFLPAEDAVRTCVLARRWLDLWKSSPGLRIHRDMGGPENAKPVRDFVDHLLLLRGGAHLDTVELRLDEVDENDQDDMRRIRLWIRHILNLRVRVLTLQIHGGEDWAELNGLAFVSNHITTLSLCGIRFEDKLLDFSCCPALEVLEIDNCSFILARALSSPSLRCLRIASECRFDECSRVRIYAPNLRSLRLEVDYERTPVLTRMPFLMEAFVELDRYSESCEICDNNSALSGGCEDDGCFGCHGVDGDEECVLLQGLSEARNLVLVSHVDIFIFRRDLKWCPPPYLAT